MQKFEAIEGLRGWMAWWVVFGHALHVSGLGAHLPPSLAAFVGSGEMAVQVFVIVSGFVITHLILSRSDKYIEYILKRYFRIAPLFVVAVALAVLTRELYAAAYIENPWALDSAMRADRMHEEQLHWFRHGILHLSMLHGAIPDNVIKYASTTLLAPAWSLSLEWQFYLLAPLIVAGMLSIRNSWIVIAIIASGALLGGLRWQMPSFLPLSIIFFMVGILSRLLLGGTASRIAILLTIISAVIYVRNLEGWEIRNICIVISIWAFFLSVCARESGILIFKSKVFDAISFLLATNKIVVSVGRVSYSTYLIHVVLFSIIIGGGVAIFGVTGRYFIYALTCSSLIATIPASFALYKYVERPGVVVGNRLLTLLARAKG